MIICWSNVKQNSVENYLSGIDVWGKLTVQSMDK